MLFNAFLPQDNNSVHVLVNFCVVVFEVWGLVFFVGVEFLLVYAIEKAKFNQHLHCCSVFSAMVDLIESDFLLPI